MESLAVLGRKRACSQCSYLIEGRGIRGKGGGTTRERHGWRGVYTWTRFRGGTGHCGAVLYNIRVRVRAVGQRFLYDSASYV
jgi:hypothetical protein